MPRTPHPRRRPGRPASDPKTAAGVREALLDAAEGLFGTRGYAAVSVREVARRAGVTPAMVHYYFGDKNGLYQAMFDHLLAKLLERVRAALAGAPDAGDGDPVAALLHTIVGTLGAEPMLPQIMAREVFSEGGRFRERFIKRYASNVLPILPAMIEAQRDAGRLRADLDPRLATISLLGMTAFPFLARPVLEPVLGLRYDEDFRKRWIEHTLRLFHGGADAPEPA